MKLEIVFPCGYKFTLQGLFLEIDFEGTDFPLCPLHGKDCKRMKE